MSICPSSYLSSYVSVCTPTHTHTHTHPPPPPLPSHTHTSWKRFGLRMCLMHQTPRFRRSVFLVDQWLSSATLLTRCVSLSSLLYVCCKWSVLKWRIKCAHVYTHPRIQPWTTITAVSSKPCASYSTVEIPLYDGDTFERVVDRIRRISGIPGKHGLLFSIYFSLTSTLYLFILIYVSNLTFLPCPILCR